MTMLEICCGDIDSAMIAARAGAQRIELCQGLEIGGVTPSAAMTALAMEKCPGLQVNVLVRPRSGDFCYSDAEKEVIAGDVGRFADMGVDAVVVGALTPDGDIDCRLMARVADICRGRCAMTFHRAFDMARDPLGALDEIITLGFDRLLTSGQAPTALEGATLLAELHRHARGAVKIMAGGGVNASNAPELLRLSHADELHASASAGVGSAMKYRNAAVNMGTPGTDEYARRTTSEAAVRALLKVLRQ